MKVTSQGGTVYVSIEPDDVTRFNRSWPGSPIPNGAKFWVELDARNGDLVNLVMWDENGTRVDTEPYDGAALLALTHDANNIAVSGGHLPQWAKRLGGIRLA